MTNRKPLLPVARPPADFATVLESDEPLFLVGGQSVNLWALYYHERTHALSPFVSRDVDILGDRDTVRKIARAVGVKPQLFPMRPPTNEVGVVIAKGADGQPLPVEVLSHIHGISNKDLCHPEYTIMIGDRGIRVRVPGPVALLQSKIANATDLLQTGRQDERHVRILACLMPAYLEDIHSSVLTGRIDEREMLRLLEHLLKAVTSRKACRKLEELGINGLLMFSELKPKASSKLHAFLTKRLTRISPG